MRDNDDEMVLDLAVASNADYIVTFNIGDFVNLELFGIEVIEPAGFLELIKEK